VTATIFEDWFSHHFVPEVNTYCANNNLPFKTLLILDSTPGHPPIPQHHHPNTEIVFLPPTRLHCFNQWTKESLRHSRPIIFVELLKG
jgi:hypothetical protein